MTPAAPGLRHPLLDACGVDHAFAVAEPRDAANDAVARPRQVHGVTVAHRVAGRVEPAEADAIVSAHLGATPMAPVGIVTADCVPILACDDAGAVVAAIHAGWRGLAAGVIEAGVAALAAARAGQGGGGLVAVIGPHIGACCYEVDAAVLDPLTARFGDAVAPATRATRPGHWLLDLGRLARRDLERAGVARSRIGGHGDACTRCDPRGFASYRRDGPRAGRMLHWIAPRRGSRQC